MVTGPAIGAHHVSAAVQGIAVGEVPALLSHAGINQPLPAAVSMDQFTRLIRAVWELLDDELMGQWPVPSRRGTFATMGLLAVHCPDLHTALGRAVAFYNLFPGGLRFHLRESGDGTRLELEPGAGVFLTESLLMIWHRFGGWLTRAPLRPEVGGAGLCRPDAQRRVRAAVRRTGGVRPGGLGIGVFPLCSASLRATR